MSEARSLPCSLQQAVAQDEMPDVHPIHGTGSTASRVQNEKYSHLLLVLCALDDGARLPDVKPLWLAAR